jgi:predicted nucleotidyltransferase
MERMSDVAQRELDKVRRIVLGRLKGRRVRVYLFGSRARDRARRWSDVDIAIEPLEPLPDLLLSDIREALEESDVVYKVDLVDLSQVGQEFRAEVEQEGVPWTL